VANKTVLDHIDPLLAVALRRRHLAPGTAVSRQRLNRGHRAECRQSDAARNEDRPDRRKVPAA
jgi:hypothetical protein